MSYAVKEMFLTLQGEGAHAGRPAVFVRFTGCNLWSGLERDRSNGMGSCSHWCDTNFVGMDGPGGGRFTTAEQLASAARALWPAPKGRPYVVCTGGEPSLQLDDRLVAALHREGFEIAVETNGTNELPFGIDWVCVSPKAGTRLAVTAGNEIKIVFPQAGLNPDDLSLLGFDHFFVQPKDGPDAKKNLNAAVSFCLTNPVWRLSLQTHKLVGIP